MGFGLCRLWGVCGGVNDGFWIMSVARSVRMIKHINLSRLSKDVCGPCFVHLSCLSLETRDQYLRTCGLEVSNFHHVLSVTDCSRAISPFLRVRRSPTSCPLPSCSFPSIPRPPPPNIQLGGLVEWPIEALTAVTARCGNIFCSFTCNANDSMCLCRRH